MTFSVAEKFASGGNLTIGEFCLWANIGKVKTYEEAREGRLRITKVGRRSVITAPDAIAWREALRAKPAHTSTNTK